MQKIIMLGAGSTAEIVANKLLNDNDCQILFFTDSNPNKIGSYIKLAEKQYAINDFNAIAQLKSFSDIRFVLGSAVCYEEHISLLSSYNIPENLIIDKYVRDLYSYRISFVKSYAKFVKDNHIKGNVAEVGGFRGDYAKIINDSFSDKLLYLFDTFEGFHKNDLTGKDFKGENVKVGYMAGTSEDLVLEKMKFPKQCRIYKGWFPESARDVDDIFCFISLDCDLYEPTLAGLKFFYPKLVTNGVIIVDDYYIEKWSGVCEAVDSFVNENGVLALPLGDERSILIIKK